MIDPDASPPERLSAFCAWIRTSNMPGLDALRSAAAELAPLVRAGELDRGTYVRELLRAAEDRGLDERKAERVVLDTVNGVRR